MEKLFILILMSSSFLNLSNCSRSTEEVVWSQKKKLKKYDFKALIPTETRHGAESAVRINYKYKLRDQLDFFDVQCVFIRNQSWISDTSQYALNHEQRHFDIGEIIARLFRKWLFENRNSLNKKSEYRIDSSFNEFHKLHLSLHQEYDQETLLNVNEQTVWDNKIDSILNTLKKFESEKRKLDYYK